MLIAELPELGELNRQEIARLIGVAPTNRGQRHTAWKKRTTGGGRVAVRNALYMPTIVAKHHNPTIKAFLRPLGRGRETEDGRPDRLHAQAREHPERHDPRRTNMETQTNNSLDFQDSRYLLAVKKSIRVTSVF